MTSELSSTLLDLISVSQLHQLPTGANQATANEQDLALARQFFEAKAHEHGFGPGFSMHHAPDLSRLETRPDLQEAWAKEQSLRSAEGPPAPAGWVNEFNAPPRFNGSGASVQSNSMAMQGVQNITSPFCMSQPFTAQPRTAYIPSMNMYSGMGMQYNYSPGLQSLDKGKGKSREADFEAAFAQVADSLSSHGQPKAEEDVERLEEALKNATLEQKEELKA